MKRDSTPLWAPDFKLLLLYSSPGLGSRLSESPLTGARSTELPETPQVKKGRRIIRFLKCAFVLPALRKTSCKASNIILYEFRSFLPTCSIGWLEDPGDALRQVLHKEKV